MHAIRAENILKGVAVDGIAHSRLAQGAQRTKHWLVLLIFCFGYHKSSSEDVGEGGSETAEHSA